MDSHACSREAREAVEIVVTHGLPLVDDALLGLASHTGCFVDWIDADDETWFGWRRLSPRVAEELRHPLDDQHAAVPAFYEPLCRRQLPDDLGLDDFWRGEGFRLIERGYWLAANDHGQFLMLFRFRFAPEPSGEPVPADEAARRRSRLIARLCRRASIFSGGQQFRGVYASFGQGDYAWKALDQAGREINRALRRALPTVAAADNPDESFVKSTGDTGFPWAFAGELDASVMTMFEREEAPESEYRSPSEREPFVYIGWNYGLISERGGPGEFANRLLPALMFMQFSYILSRAMQRVVMAEMGRVFEARDGEALRESSERFDLIALNFERFSLDYTRFLDSRFPRVGRAVRAIAERWNMASSLERLSAGVSRQREIIASQYDHDAHRDSRRQEMILFAIALLQIFALVSVVTDYQALNATLLGVDWPPRATPTGEGWEAEAWIVGLGSWLPRVLAAVAVVLAGWFYGKSARRRLRGAVGRLKSAARRLAARRRPRFERAAASPRCEPRRSRTHGVGLFVKSAVSPGETIFEFPGGRRVEAAAHFRENGQAAEWNSVEGGFLYVRAERTDYGWINHSRRPNARVEFDRARESFRVVCEAPAGLSENDEVLIDYRREPLPEEYLIRWGGYL